MAKFKLYSSERGARLKFCHYRGATPLGRRYFLRFQTRLCKRKNGDTEKINERWYKNEF